MKTIKNDWTVFFDVDDTLIIYDFRPDAEGRIKVFFEGRSNYFVPNDPTIDRLKDLSESGANVVVWSAAGYQWAASVVRALGLTDWVHLVMAKPIEVYDDLEPHEFLTRLEPMVKKGYQLTDVGIKPIEKDDSNNNS